MAESERAKAVYVSWKTFQNSIEQLSKVELLNVIDKTVFTGMAFSVQNQLFTGMRFLGLIDEKNKPTDQLAALVSENEDGRKVILSKIFQSKYSELFALNLKKTTPDEFGRKMTEVYGNAGDTKDKAIRFFLGAAEYLGIEMSPLFFSKKSNVTRPPRKRAAPRKVPVITNLPAEHGGTSKIVRLKSGGNLTLSATLDLFSLNAEDRKFVFELIDRLDGYKQPEEKAVGNE